MAPRGTPISGATRKPEEQQTLRQLGDANAMPRGTSLGSGKAGTFAGKADACFVEVRPGAVASTTLLVPHSFGRVPAWARVHEVIGSPVGLVVGSVQKDRWTSTTLRVSVSVTSGTLAGVKIKLLVGG
jgi:hypothetical protein